MNFLRLFAAGKSVIGMRNSTSPYRMKPGVALPKFGSSKNPFAPPAASEPPKSGLCKPEAATETNAVSAARATGPVKLETAPLFESAAAEPVKPLKAEAAKTPAAKLPPIQPAQPELRPAAPALEGKARKPLAVGAWVRKLNPLALLPSRQPGARGSRSRSPRPVVQGELSLEKVKVMRNDLSDTDLEIVPARPAMKSAPGRTPSAAVALDEATAWDRLTARFFNTEETQVR